MAIAVKSIMEGPCWIACISSRESEPATGLLLPLMCLISEVNWEMKSSCRICCGKYLFEFVCREKVRGL